MATKPQKIDIGIRDKQRKEIAQGLSKLLADTYTLYLTTHNFHWNVTGPMFNTLHTMLPSLVFFLHLWLRIMCLSYLPLVLAMLPSTI